MYLDGGSPRNLTLSCPCDQNHIPFLQMETVEYQYFVVDPGFKEDKWITAAEVVPGNRGIVHHSIVFVRPPDGERFRGVGWLAAYVPGQSAPPFVSTRARFVPAAPNSSFNNITLQMAPNRLT